MPGICWAGGRGWTSAVSSCSAPARHRDGGPLEFAFLAARAGWLDCRDSMCTAEPVPDLDVDEASVGPMMTGTAPISWAPPEVQAAHEARLRAAAAAP
jgi:hypothetical protein